CPLSGRNSTCRPVQISGAGSVMAIERHLIMDSAGFKPIISRAVVQDGVVHLCGVTPDPVGDIVVQTRQTLERIDQLLAVAGTDKSKLLSAQVWLPHMRPLRPPH